MQDKLKDILTHLSTEVDQETLLLYLQGKLTAEQQHELEKQMVDNPFAADALEGLQTFKDKRQIQFLIDQLNRDLKKKTEKKKAYKEKLRLRQDPWIVITIFIILMLVVISFLIIQKYLQ